MFKTHMTAINKGYRAGSIHMESSPGVGKTDTAFQYCEQMCLALNEPVGMVQFLLATLGSSADVRGWGMPEKHKGRLMTSFALAPWFPVEDKNVYVCIPDPQGHNGVRWYSHGTWEGPLPRVGVLFLDEFSQAEDDIKKPAAELIYKGNVGTCELPPNWRVIAAGNRSTDRSGALRDMMYLVNRRCKLPIEPHLGTWLNWANGQPEHTKPHYMFRSFAQNHPGIVFPDAVPDGNEAFCTPRSLCLCDRDLRALRSAEEEEKDLVPTDRIAQEYAKGWIGEAAQRQLFIHMRFFDILPDMDDLLSDPMTAKLPPGQDGQMVICYKLADMFGHAVGASVKMSEEAQALAMFRYIKRCNIEMQALAVRTIQKSKRMEKVNLLHSTSGWNEWIAKNSQLLLASAG
jgi:hypothetical protein